MWFRGMTLVFVFALLSTVVFHVGGCSNNSSAVSPTDQSNNSGPPADAGVPVMPLLKDWPKPALALILTGERHGYLEPCGCSLTQSGGMMRLADLIEQIRKREWPILPLDLGGTVKRDRRQTKFKFHTLLAAMKDLDYKALALGMGELRLEQTEPGYLLTEFEVNTKEPQPVLPFLAANVSLFGTPEFGVPNKDGVNVPLITRSRVVTAGETKVGVTAIVGKNIRMALLPQGAQTELTIDDPEAALPAIIDDLKKQSPQLLVLLSHADKAESRALAEKFPDFDIVLTTGGEEGSETPEMIGKTWLVDVGHKGKYAGVLGFYPNDAAKRLRFELVDLDNKRFHDNSKMHDRMREYQNTLKDNYDTVLDDLPKSPHPSGARYVGAAKCGECHTKAYQKWKIDTEDEPHHSRAYKSLSIGRKGQEKDWIPRIHDPECLACHVTGWDPQEIFPYDSGFISEAKSPFLTAQQCENCHGPGSKHVALEELWKKDRKTFTDEEGLINERKAIKLTKELAEKQVCARCHDYENSPGFKFPEYWKKIEHPWKD